MHDICDKHVLNAVDFFFFLLVTGFLVIMVNFNHERFALAVMSNRAARVCIEEAVQYARVRRTFGYVCMSSVSSCLFFFVFFFLSFSFRLSVFVCFCLLFLLFFCCFSPFAHTQKQKQIQALTPSYGCRKRLIDHQVIRHKIADMVARVESVHSLLEQLCFQMKNVRSSFLSAKCLCV